MVYKAIKFRFFEVADTLLSFYFQDYNGFLPNTKFSTFFFIDFTFFLNRPKDIKHIPQRKTTKNGYRIF